MKTKKILIVSTGGTIASVEDHGVRHLDSVGHFSGWLREKALDMHLPCEFSFISPIFTFSENMTVQKWGIIVNALREELKKSTYDGVVITHGSDTLAYTSSLLALLTHGLNIPIMMVASAHPLDYPNSNGWTNFAAALRFIVNTDYHGVFVAYSYDNKVTNIYAGERVLQSQPFVDMYFSFGQQPDFGVVNQDGVFEPKDIDLCNKKSIKATKEPLLFSTNIDLTTVQKSILIVTPFVGLDFCVFDLGNVETVIINPYHSSTFCNLEEDSIYCITQLMKNCDAFNIPLVIAPCRPNAPKYTDSKFKLFNMENISLETIYAKILLANAQFEKGSIDWYNWLSTPLAHEYLSI